MKRKIFIIIAVLAVLAVLLFPIKYQLKDGGTVKYKAILYEVTSYNKLLSENGRMVGTEVKIFGITVFSNTKEKILHTDDGVPEFANKTYIYENGGFGGVFHISIHADGTFNYYEGMLSSYIGGTPFCSWEFDGEILTLTDTTLQNRDRVNYFRVEDGCLVFLEEKSDNFMYVKVKEGERFNETDEKTFPIEVKSDI